MINWIKNLLRKWIGIKPVVEYQWYDTFSEDDTYHNSIAKLEKNKSLANMLNKLYVGYTISGANALNADDWKRYKNYKDTINLIKLKINDSLLWLKSKREAEEAETKISKYKDSEGNYQYKPIDQEPGLN